MIELIFTDSGAAHLGMAKKTGDKSSMSVVQLATEKDGNETTETFSPEPYNGPFIEGDYSDIAPIWLSGDIGDISNLPDWTSRLKIIRELSDDYGMEDDGWIAEEGQRAQALVKRLSYAAVSGEPVRIWWSDTAEETCGYYWAVDILKDAKGPVSSINIPRMWPVDDHKIINGTWDMEPQDFHWALCMERQIESDERRAIALYWRILVSENAPLRAVISGLPCSVPESFYDYVIYQYIPKGDFRIIDLVAQALVKGPGLVRDWWYARRVRNMIACGELEIVAEVDKFYYTTVRRGPTLA